jgi:hypothetical protein
VLNGHRGATPRPFVLISVDVNAPTGLRGFYYGALLSVPVGGCAKLRVSRGAADGRDLLVEGARESELGIRGEWTWFRRQKPGK